MWREPAYSQYSRQQKYPQYHRVYNPSQSQTSQKRNQLYQHSMRYSHSPTSEYIHYPPYTQYPYPQKPHVELIPERFQQNFQYPQHFTSNSVQIKFWSNCPQNPVIISNSLRNIDCIVLPQTQRGGLYIGDIISTMKQQLLNSHKIEAILCCIVNHTGGLAQKNFKYYKCLPLTDSLDCNIIKYFQEAYNFIEENIVEGRNVLVHCHAGVSRSVAVVSSYLMKKHKMSVKQSLECIRQKRPRIKPNENFIKQLEDYQFQLGKESKVRIQKNKNQNPQALFDAHQFPLKLKEIKTSAEQSSRVKGQRMKVLTKLKKMNNEIQFQRSLANQNSLTNRENNEKGSQTESSIPNRFLSSSYHQRKLSSGSKIVNND